ncbi:hypothetical protein sos41_17930 [Alphaproteobacteria bacterium SO-S41]|nr:hypothetical protein sos41_17930 [Alphaproteobacteria bacterium SO-S41]
MPRAMHLLLRTLVIAAPLAAPAFAADLNDCSEPALKAENTKTYDQLKKAGDIAERMRPTSFYFFGEADKITAISKVLTENGFVMAEASDGGKAIIAATNAAMVPDTFDQLTIKVCVTANTTGVTYDGWETVVVKK